MNVAEKKTPAYLRLYDTLRRRIIAGDYPYGTRLPSKRALSEETGLSVVTVEHALALLCDEGYLEPRERSGHYVSFRESEGFVPESAPVRPVPTEGAGERTVFPMSVLARTMRRVISDYGERLLERCPSQGCGELRSALSRYLCRAVELLPLGPDGISTEALAAARASVLHITPYRSYPSNVTASAAKRREYVRWAERGDRYVVEDDFTSELAASARPEETVFSLSKRGNVIYLNTFSLTVAPSLRMGYLALSETAAALFRERVGFYACTVPVFEQYVLSELIDSGDYERHVRRSRRQLRKKRG